MRKQSLVVVLTVLMLSCAGKAPPSLSPVGVKYWQGNQAVVAIGTLQHAAIGLNGVQVCEPAPCHPLLSDANTRIVVDAVEVALKTMKAVPDGWRGAADAALTTVGAQLDAAGKTQLQFYLEAARSILKSI